MDPLAAAATVTANAIKIAEAYKAQAEKAARDSRAADPGLVEKAAQALVDGAWLKAAQLDEAKATLADPNKALALMAELAVKSAEAIDSARQAAGLDPRLAAGQALPAAAPGDANSKQASETAYVGSRPENEADRNFTQRILSYRTQMNGDGAY